jgi:hypothetical protein
MEMKLACFEKLFNELSCGLHLHSSSNDGVKPLPYSVLSTVLVDVVQGTSWDSPDILSPLRGRKWPNTVVEADPLNLVFVCSPSPSQVGQLVSSNDLCVCLLKQKIALFWISECSDKDVKGSAEVFSPISGTLMNLIPPPPSVISFSQAAVVKKHTSVTSPQNHLVSSDHFWLCNNGTPMGIIQVEPFLIPTCGCGFVSKCDHSLKEALHSVTQWDLFLKPFYAANHAIIVGVVRQSDIPSFLLHTMYSSTGLSVPLSSFKSRLFIQQNLHDTLKGTNKFSQEYQNLSAKLTSSKMLLLLMATVTSGNTGLCVLEPVSSVTSTLSILKPCCARAVALTLSQYQDFNLAEFYTTDMEKIDLEGKLCKQMSYPELYYKLESPFLPVGEKAGITLSYKDWLFSVESLLPWYPFVPCHGVSTACFETINELQEKCLLKKAVPGWQTVKDFLKVLSAYSQKERDVTEVVVPVERLVNYPTPSLFTAGSKQSV